MDPVSVGRRRLAGELYVYIVEAEEHSAEVIQGMLDRLAALKKQGRDVIED